jgi:hypothetical protein
VSQDVDHLLKLLDFWMSGPASMQPPEVCLDAREKSLRFLL